MLLLTFVRLNMRLLPPYRASDCYSSLRVDGVVVRLGPRALCQGNRKPLRKPRYPLKLLEHPWTRHGMRSIGRTKLCPPLFTFLPVIRNCFRRCNNRLLCICHSPTTSLTSRSAFLICVNFASISCAKSSTCVIIASIRV